MIILIVIFLFLLAVYAFLFFKIAGKLDNGREGGLLLLYTIVTAFLMVSLVSIIETINTDNVKSKPTALDVYRGNTDIQTIKTLINDSIVEIDTIVVFKEKINK